MTSTAAESLTFDNPTNSLTIDGGTTGSDSIVVTGLGSGFAAALSLSATDGVTLSGADADVTVVDPETGKPTMSLVAGKVVMRAGEATGSGGTLLVTVAGEAAAKESGLGYQVVDLAQSKLYQDWR